MTNWINRAKSRMEALHLTHEMLAEKMGLTRGAITHYLSGRREPSLHQLIKLAQTLRTTPSWLQFGIDKQSIPVLTTPGENFEPVKLATTAVPVITWEQAAQWPTLAKRYKPKKTTEFLPFVGKIHQQAFALQVRGDSMEGFAGNSFPQGTYILVEVNHPPVSGNYVIARLGNDREAIFKQFICEGKQRFLKSLNTQYPVIEIKGRITFCGIVRQAIQQF